MRLVVTLCTYMYIQYMKHVCFKLTYIVTQKGILMYYVITVIIVTD